MMGNDYAMKAAGKLMPPKKEKGPPEPMEQKGPEPGPESPAEDKADMAGAPTGEAPPDMHSAAKKRAGDLAADLPTPQEPLSPQAVEMFELNLGKAVRSLSGGQVPVPEPMQVDAPLPQLPAPLYVMGKTLSAALTGGPLSQDPRYKPFAFDMREAASSSAGLAEAAQKLNGIAKLGPPSKAPAAPPPEEPPAPEAGGAGAPPDAKATAARLMPGKMS